MAYKIDEGACINCGACEAVCPAEAISEVNDKRSIDADKCAGCGSCVGECPVEAISEA